MQVSEEKFNKLCNKYDLTGDCKSYFRRYLTASNSGDTEAIAQDVCLLKKKIQARRQSINPNSGKVIDMGEEFDPWQEGIFEGEGQRKVTSKDVDKFVQEAKS